MAPSALLLALLLGIPRLLTGQVEADPVLDGQVLLGDSTLSVGTVVLHLLSAEEERAVDSVAVGVDGRFSLRLPRVPDPERSEVFFATVEHQDIVYVGGFITMPIQLDSLYTIHAYDTTSAPAEGGELAVHVRNIFLEAVQGGWQATDVFQVHNEGTRTLVARDGGVVWRHPLPPAATDATLGQSDVVPGGTVVEGGDLVVRSPMPPGEKLFVVRYRLPDVFLEAPTPVPVEQLDVLVREPAPPLAAPGLSAAQPVEFEPGSTYRRFLAREWSGDAVRLEGAEETRLPPVQWLAVGLALLMTVAGLWAVHGGPGPGRTAVAGPVPDAAPDGPGGADAERDRVILEIARLDEAFAARTDPDEAAREAYRRARRDLLARLR